MISDGVIRIKEKNGEITILTKKGLLLRLSGEEVGWFKRVMNLKKYVEATKTAPKTWIDQLIYRDILKFIDSPLMIKEEKIPYDLRILDYEGDKPLYDAPIMVHLAIEELCNLNCVYCSVREAHRRVSKKLSINEWKKVIDLLEEWGAGQVTFTGGEPLINFERLVELVRYTSKKAIAMSLSTNGMLLTKEKAQKLYDAGLRLIQLSLDSNRKEINDSLRGRGVTEVVIKRIKMLIEMGMTVGVDCVVSNKNIKYLEELVLFLDNLKVPYLTLLKLKHGSLDKEKYISLLPSYNEYAEVIRKIAYLQKRLKYLHITLDCGSVANMVKAFNEKELKSVPVMGCPIGHTQIVINPNGDIYPCAALLDERFKLGNVMSDDIISIWHESEKLKKMRKWVQNLKGKCSSCKMRRICRGGCRGIAYALTKDILEQDPSCDYSSL